MKKIAIFTMLLALSLSLCACACTNNAPATTPTTNPTNNTTTNTRPSVMPTETMTIPVPETNISDPSVNTTLPTDMMPDGSETAGEGSRAGLPARIME